MSPLRFLLVAEFLTLSSFLFAPFFLLTAGYLIGSVASPVRVPSGRHHWTGGKHR